MGVRPDAANSGCDRHASRPVCLLGPTACFALPPAIAQSMSTCTHVALAASLANSRQMHGAGVMLHHSTCPPLTACSRCDHGPAAGRYQPQQGTAAAGTNRTWWVCAILCWLGGFINAAFTSLPADQFHTGKTARASLCWRCPLLAVCMFPCLGHCVAGPDSRGCL